MTDHHQRINLPRNDIIVQDFLPVFVHGSLTISNQADTGFHDCADVEVIGEACVDTGDTDAAVRTDTADHFVEDFGGICFETDGNLKGVEISFHEFTYELDIRKRKDVPAAHSRATSRPPGTSSSMADLTDLTCL